MFAHLRARLTYANVTATCALFLALGGTSYAAFTLPRNSVGSNQIRAGAVRSSELHNGSITLVDVSRRARAALRGAPGAPGPVGPAGPAGAPALRYFEAVSSTGSLVSGTATSGGRSTSIGSYVIGFAGSTSGCAAVATLGTTDASIAAAGHITTSDQGGRVGVQTYDASGAPADLPFQLIVAC